MRLLFVSNLFPDAAEPIRGLDNALILESLAAQGVTEARVLSPRPRLERWLGDVGTPAQEPLARHRKFEPVYVAVRHLPKLGGIANAALMRRDLRDSFRQVCESFEPDVVLGSWLFPDGCVLAKLCEETGLPLVLVAQGTDVHGYLESPSRRTRILAAVASARATICRSGDLAKRLAAAGAAPERLKVVYNGVDPEVFRPRDRRECRTQLGIAGEEPLLLFVGNLLPVKDPLFLLRAVASWNEGRAASGLPAARLRLVGEGPLRPQLEGEMVRLGASDWASLLGRRPPEEVALWMGAADLLCLSSRNEGFPNVILEAMACGLSVVSTDVGGIGEKVGTEAVGRLVPPGDKVAYAAAVAAAVAAALSGVGREPKEGIASPSWAAAAESYVDILRAASAGVPPFRGS